MKKFFSFCCFIFIAFLAFATPKEKRYISVEKTHLKNGTGFFAKKICQLYYGDEVILLEKFSKNKKWIKVQTSKSQIGYVSTSTLTKKKIVKNEKKVSVSAKELSLAGKGFTSEIETEYKKTSSANYDNVDMIESFSLSDEALQSFITEGNLQGVGK